MATLIQLAKGGDLFPYEPELDPGIQPFRWLYGSPRLKTWIENDLPKLPSDWDLENTPEEQLVAFLDDVYCPGEPLTYENQFKPLTHIKDGIWELKTTDLRLFGWFWRKDCFVASACGYKATLAQIPGLYFGYAAEAERFRDQLDLDGPKFIPGDNPHAVVSNFGYA